MSLIYVRRSDIVFIRKFVCMLDRYVGGLGGFEVFVS